MKQHLYPIFAEKWNHNGSLYFYSDPHFGDEEMKYLRKNYIGDDEQVRRINSKVGKNDTIVFLGDIGDVEYIKKIKGYKVLIMGNHDKGASNYKRKIIEIEHNSDTCPKCSGKVIYDDTTFHNCGFEYAWCHTCGTVKPKDDIYEDNHLFNEVYEGPLMISDRILLSHEPIALPYVFNIHGHDHSNCEKVASHHFNMCAEHINYTPVSLKEILKSGMMKEVPDIHRYTIDKRGPGKYVIK